MMTIGDLIDGKGYDLTIGDLLDGKGYGPDAHGCCLYVVRDGGAIFYVGRSEHVIERLRGHLAISDAWPYRTDSPSPLGRFVNANMPDARKWGIELYSLSDLGIEHGNVARIEAVLVGELRPCLNSTHNPNPSPMPVKYRQYDDDGAGAIRATLAAFGEA